MSIRLHLSIIFMMHAYAICLGQHKFVNAISGLPNTYLMSATKITTDSNYYIGGETNYTISSTNYKKPVLLKYDVNGNLIWSKMYQFSFPNNQFRYGFTKLIYSKSANLIYGIGLISQDTAAWPIVNYYSFYCSIDTSGNIVKLFQLKPSLNFELNDLIETSDSGLIILGSINSVGIFADSSKTTMSKYDSNLNPLWTRTYSGGVSFKGIAIAQLKDSSFIISGNIVSDSLTGYHSIFAGISSFGIPLWVKRSFTNSFEHVGDYDHYILSENDSFIISSHSNTSGNLGFDRVEFLKLNRNGNILWQKAYPCNGAPDNKGLQSSTNEGFAILSNSRLLKFDSTGVLEFSSRYFNALNYTFSSLSHIFDVGYLITGSIIGKGLVAETDTSGGFYCNNTVSFQPSSMATNTVYITDSLSTNLSSISGTVLNYIVIDTLLSSTDYCFNSVEENEAFKNISIYPNPNAGILNVQFHNIKEAFSYEVSDVYGRKVLSSKGNSTDNKIDLSEQPQGIYIVSANLDGKLWVEKIIKE